MSDRLQKWRDDSGAMLVIALIIITVVAVVTGALLSHGVTNFRATVGLRGVAGTSYAADAAAKLAINNLRLGRQAPGWVDPTFPGAWDKWVYTNNADGTGCFGADGEIPRDELLLENVYPAAGDQTGDSSAVVRCTPVSGTGVFGGGAGVVVGDDPTDAFARALTTVGTTNTLGLVGIEGHGITVRPQGSGGSAPIPIRGGVASRSFINVVAGTLVTDGYVRAQGNCLGNIVAGVDENNVEQRFCNAAGSVPVPATPPSPASSVPTYRDAADYSSSCEFQPGFYNNAAALNSAVNGCDGSGGKPSVAHFNSGVYYFDFVDEEHSGQNVWNITTNVIGGETTADTTIPGRCRSPINNNSVTGVQFVFGHTSRMTVSDTAHVELCGPSNGGEAPMTLYQQQSDSTPPAAAPITDVPASSLTRKTGNGGGFKWTDGRINGTTLWTNANAQSAITAADANSIRWTVTGNNDDIGFDLQNFPGLAAIPAGSDITSAQLRVKYSKLSAKTLSVTVKDQTPANVAISAPDGSGWGTADVASQLRTASQDGAFTATTPTFELRMLDAAKDDTLTIDAVQLSVSYTPPSLRHTTDVKFIDAPAGNFQGEFVVQGATYAPTGFVRLVPGSGGGSTALVAFRWGLLAMGVDFKALPSQPFGYPLVSIPGVGTGLGSRVTVVDLEVFVCVESSTCTSSGDAALKVRVMITDPPYNTSGTYEGVPEPGRRQIKVLSWAEQN